ncbi:MAG: DUF2158 domain-containing protein [Rhodothermales bacterium]
MNRFREGDTVRLKSGGPRMKVGSATPIEGFRACTWPISDEMNEGWFPETYLVKVEPSQEHKT